MGSKPINDKKAIADLARLRAYYRLLDEIAKEEAAFEKVLQANRDDLFLDEYDRHNNAMANYMMWKKEMEEELRERNVKGPYLLFLKKQLQPS